jgi:hypothetical protein
MWRGECVTEKGLLNYFINTYMPLRCATAIAYQFVGPRFPMEGEAKGSQTHSALIVATVEITILGYTNYNKNF